MVRRFVAMVVALLSVMGVLTAVAPPASARPEPYDTFRPGAAAMALQVETSGIHLTGTTSYPTSLWGGPAVVDFMARASTMYCAGYAETEATLALETGAVRLLCSGEGPLGPSALNCDLLILRVGAVMELDGECVFFTPGSSLRVLAAGVLAFAPTPPVATVLTDYALAGSIGLAKSTVIGPAE